MEAPFSKENIFVELAIEKKIKFFKEDM